MIRSSLFCAVGVSSKSSRFANRFTKPFAMLLGCVLMTCVTPSLTLAKSSSKEKEPQETKSNGKHDKAEAGKAGKPVQIGKFDEWGVFTAQAKGKGKTCYALARPKDRQPASLKRDDAYVFISSRPGENVRNELSIIMGFAMKDGSEPKADINGAGYELVAKGSNAWVKNPAEEGQFIDSMKKGSKLVIKAASIRGNQSTDSYSLSGLSDALARVAKECP